MYCALNPDRTVRIEDVSAAYGISRAHLLKAARQLGQLGYLKNMRGRGGGVRLGLDPAEIVIGAVVRHTEGDLDLVECFNADTNSCPLMDACKLSLLFKSGLAAFLAELDKATLADIVANGALLRERLDEHAKAS